MLFLTPMGKKKLGEIRFLYVKTGREMFLRSLPKQRKKKLVLNLIHSHPRYNDNDHPFLANIDPGPKVSWIL